jgi:hypothetical protein
MSYLYRVKYMWDGNWAADYFNTKAGAYKRIAELRRLARDGDPLVDPGHIPDHPDAFIKPTTQKGWVRFLQQVGATQ